MPGAIARVTSPRTRRPSTEDGAARTPDVADVVDGVSTETAWWRTVAIGGAALASAIALLVLVWLLARPLALFIGAVVIASALAPLVSRLERWMPRAVAVIVLYMSLVAFIGIMGWFFMPPLISQGRELFEQAPDLVTRGRRWLDRLDPIGGDQLVARAQSGVSGLADVMITLPVRVFSSILEFILVLFMSAYWLISGPPLRRFFLSLFPAERRDKADGIVEAMGATMGGYVRATIINGIAVGIMVYVGLLLIGVQYPILLALLAALGEFIPILGPILASVPAIAVALLDSPTQALIVAGFYLVMQQIESNLLVPNIMRNQADIPPLPLRALRWLRARRPARGADRDPGRRGTPDPRDARADPGRAGLGRLGWRARTDVRRGPARGMRHRRQRNPLAQFRFGCRPGSN